MSYLLSIIIIALIPATIIISRNITLKEYYSNFGKTGTTTIALSLLASLLGGWMFFGLTKIGYEAGSAGIYIGIGYSLGFVLLYFLIPKIRNTLVHYQANTMDECVRKYYGANVGLIVVVVNFIFFVGVLAAQFIALSLLLEPFKDSLNIDIIYWSFSVSVIIYTSISGFKGVIFSDKFQLFLILFVLGIMAYSILGNLPKINSLDTSFFYGTNYGIAFPIAAIVFFPLSVLARTDIWQRIASSNSEKSIKRAILIAIPILLICYFILVLSGMTLRALPETSVENVNVFQLLINEITNNQASSSIFIIIIILGIGSSLLSTIDTNISVITAAFNNFLFKEVKNEKTVLLSARIVSCGIGVLGLIVALFMNNIVDIIVSAGAIILILLPIVFNMIKQVEKGIYTASRSEQIRSVITLLMGYIVFGLIFKFIDPKAAFIPGFIVSVIIWPLSKIFVKKAIN